MVMAQSLFIVLKQAGAHAIDVLAPAWSRPLLQRMPQVRRAIDLPTAHGELALGKRYRIGKSLRQEGYEQVIVLPNSFKSALLPLFARIPRRTGWRGEMRGALLNDCRLLDKQSLPLMVQRFVALGLPPDLPQQEREAALQPENIPRPDLQLDQTSVEQSLQELGAADRSRPRLMLCPGAEFGDSKQWPATHFADLGNLALAQGWQLMISGSARDAGVAADIIQRLDTQWRQHCLDLTGKTSLGQAIDVLSTATAVVSNDSGLMHVAAALQRPLLALYGSTSADFTPPLSDKVTLLNSDIDCRPCFQRSCPFGHKRCLTELSPALAWQAIQELLAPSGPKQRVYTITTDRPGSQP